MSTPIDSLTTGGDDQPQQPEPTIHNVHERRRQAAPAVLFVAGLAMVLWGGLTTFDSLGPTSTEAATVTDVDTTSRRGRVSYTIGGTDVDGGTFRMDASREAYQSAQVGDDVTVERALITARVVRIDGPGWENDSSPRAIISIIVAVLGVAALLWAVATVRRRRVDRPEEPSLLYRTRWALPVVAVAAVGWVVWERSNASGDAPAAAPTTETAPTETAQTGTVATDCRDLGAAALAALDSAIDRGFVDAAATRSAMTDLAIAARDCDRADVDAAVCTALADAAAADQSLVVVTDGLCPQTP